MLLLVSLIHEILSTFFRITLCALGIFISGILLDNFAEIRDNVKKTTMETYFDAGHLSHYVTQKTEIILNSLQLGNMYKLV